MTNPIKISPNDDDKSTSTIYPGPRFVTEKRVGRKKRRGLAPSVLRSGLVSITIYYTPGIRVGSPH